MEEVVKEKYYHKVNHSYRDKIIVPMIAVTNNYRFVITDEQRYIITADEVKCKVTHIEVRNIFDLESDIDKIYKLSAWDFLKRWYNVNNNLSSIDFFVIELKKEE